MSQWLLETGTPHAGGPALSTRLSLIENLWNLQNGTKETYISVDLNN